MRQQGSGDPRDRWVPPSEKLVPPPPPELPREASSLAETPTFLQATRPDSPRHTGHEQTDAHPLQRGQSSSSCCFSRNMRIYIFLKEKNLTYLNNP